MTESELLRLVARIRNMPQKQRNGYGSHIFLQKGLTLDEIRATEETLGIVFPEPLRQWFRICDGGQASGTLYSLTKKSNHHKELVTIAEMYSIYPEWKINGWIPIASDGCGNPYLAVSTKRDERTYCPVVFADLADTENDVDPLGRHGLSYIVASNIFTFWKMFFMQTILEYESDEDCVDFWWPFDTSKVSQQDPEIVTFPEFVLPWNAT